jgi:hypothetical protein
MSRDTVRETQAQGSDRGPWIQTFTGRAFHYEDPQPEDVHIEDIAQALSKQCRFAGHTTRFYSVAEHSVLVSKQFVNPELRMLGLLHDATEAYVLDLPKPLKSLLPAYKDYEDRLWRVIAAKFNLPVEIPAEIHEIDLRMLITERPQLFRQTIPWPKYADVAPLTGVEISCWSPGAAYIDFMLEFRQIEWQR